MRRKIVETSDGSKTIHLEDWNENYHSHHGALQEAKHVFIDKVRERLLERKQISILEMGFGTGLNAFLTLQLALELNIKIRYVALEAFPVNQEEMDALNYASIWEEGRLFYERLHRSKWEVSTVIAENFDLTKHNITFEEWDPQIDAFDFVYFDAFGPRVQPQLWTVPIFQKMWSTTKIGGYFLTYCAKGQVRRDLQTTGFTVHRLPGPPGKREMLVGEKNEIS